MKRIFWIIFILTIYVLVVTGCNPEDPETPIPVVSLDTTDISTVNQVKASAVVVPAQEARLSFVVPGLVEDVAIEEGNQVQAGQALVKLDTTELEFALSEAQAALTSAEIDAQIQRQRRRKFDFDTFNFIYVSTPGEKIQAADAKVDQMQSALDAAKASLVQSTLVAPFEGTVVEVGVSPGEYVRPSQVIIRLARLENLQIETTDLSELNIATVKIGQPATVFVESLNEEFSGKVAAISPISNTLGGDVVFKVTIQLYEQPKGLLWGMSADVQINIE